ncbi:MAG: signal peptidase I [Acholeplasmataceae bacterium]|nr:signal peptidase I [Acholeplasmataceae bacterium]
MNGVSLKGFKFKIISLIISSVIIIFFQRFRRFNFDFLKRTYVLIIVALTLILIITSVLVLLYVPDLNYKVKKLLYNTLDFFQTLTFALVLFLCIFTFWFFPATVQGRSMMPTLVENNRVLISVGNKKLSRFDIVVIDATELLEVHSEDDLIIKRIIGLPGDNFYYQDGKLYLYVDGIPTLIEEPYLVDEEGNFLKNGILYDTETEDFTLSDFCIIGSNLDNQCEINGEIKIPGDYFFVMGDNRGRNKSVDSRTFGLIHRSKIVGKAKYIRQGLFKWKKLK